MRIEQLLYLVEIAKTHSISIAAENLYVSQPAISAAIKKLEEELGTTLFSRSKNGVFLTSVGEAVLTEAEIILSHANNITEIVNRYQYAARQTITGTLKVHLPPAVNNWLLNQLLPEFRKVFPDIALDCIENNPEEILNLLASRDYDLHVFSTINDHFEESISTLCSRHPGLQIQFLAASKQYVSVSKDSSLAKKKSISLKELCTLPVGSLSYSFYDFDYMSRITQNIAPPNIVFKTNSLAVLSEQIRQNNCVSISVSFQPEMDNIVLIPVSNALRLKFFCSFYTDNEKLPAIDHFLALLKSLL